jgi:hypothetical protein
MRGYHCNELIEHKQVFHLGIAHKKIIIYLFTKQATLVRRSPVLSPPPNFNYNYDPQFVFTGKGFQVLSKKL